LNRIRSEPDFEAQELTRIFRGFKHRLTTLPFLQQLIAFRRKIMRLWPKLFGSNIIFSRRKYKGLKERTGKMSSLGDPNHPFEFELEK
jgi:hypothetical protein